MAKNLELYNKTVDILFNAYFNDTLRHGDCCACAIGNIIAANNEYRIVAPVKDTFKMSWFAKDGEQLPYPGSYDSAASDGWGAAICTNMGVQEINKDLYDFSERVKHQIDSTGYTFYQVAMIEKAFEEVDGEDDERMFNGLVAVLEVLKDIHEISDNEPEVSRFKEHYKVKQLS